jgi:hypothetical protein
MHSQLLKGSVAVKGAMGHKAYSTWSVGGSNLDQRLCGIRKRGISIPFAHKWLKSGVVKLSEKGLKRRSEHGFGLYIGTKTGQIVRCMCSERLRFGCLQDLSDSFVRGFHEVRC